MQQQQQHHNNFQHNINMSVGAAGPSGGAAMIPGRTSVPTSAAMPRGGAAFPSALSSSNSNSNSNNVVNNNNNNNSGNSPVPAAMPQEFLQWLSSLSDKVSTPAATPPTTATPTSTTTNALHTIGGNGGSGNSIGTGGAPTPSSSFMNRAASYTNNNNNTTNNNSNNAGAAFPSQEVDRKRKHSPVSSPIYHPHSSLHQHQQLNRTSSSTSAPWQPHHHQQQQYQKHSIGMPQLPSSSASNTIGNVNGRGDPWGSLPAFGAAAAGGGADLTQRMSSPSPHSTTPLTNALAPSQQHHNHQHHNQHSSATGNAFAQMMQKQQQHQQYNHLSHNEKTNSNSSSMYAASLPDTAASAHNYGNNDNDQASLQALRQFLLQQMLRVQEQQYGIAPGTADSIPKQPQQHHPSAVGQLHRNSQSFNNASVNSNNKNNTNTAMSSPHAQQQQAGSIKAPPPGYAQSLLSPPESSLSTTPATMSSSPSLLMPQQRPHFQQHQQQQQSAASLPVLPALTPQLQQTLINALVSVHPSVISGLSPAYVANHFPTYAAQQQQHQQQPSSPWDRRDTASPPTMTDGVSGLSMADLAVIAPLFSRMLQNGTAGEAAGYQYDHNAHHHQLQSTPSMRQQPQAATVPLPTPAAPAVASLPHTSAAAAPPPYSSPLPVHHNHLQHVSSTNSLYPQADAVARHGLLPDYLNNVDTSVLLAVVRALQSQQQPQHHEQNNTSASLLLALQTLLSSQNSNNSSNNTASLPPRQLPPPQQHQQLDVPNLLRQIASGQLELEQLHLLQGLMTGIAQKQQQQSTIPFPGPTTLPPPPTVHHHHHHHHNMFHDPAASPVGSPPAANWNAAAPAPNQPAPTPFTAGHRPHVSQPTNSIENGSRYAIGVWYEGTVKRYNPSRGFGFVTGKFVLYSENLKDLKPYIAEVRSNASPKLQGPPHGQSFMNAQGGDHSGDSDEQDERSSTESFTSPAREQLEKDDAAGILQRYPVELGDIFIHHSCISMHGFRSLPVDAKVRFCVAKLLGTVQAVDLVAVPTTPTTAPQVASVSPLSSTPTAPLTGCFTLPNQVGLTESSSAPASFKQPAVARKSAVGIIGAPLRSNTTTNESTAPFPPTSPQEGKKHLETEDGGVTRFSPLIDSDGERSAPTNTSSPTKSDIMGAEEPHTLTATEQQRAQSTADSSTRLRKSKNTKTAGGSESMSAQTTGLHNSLSKRPKLRHQDLADDSDDADESDSAFGEWNSLFRKKIARERVKDRRMHKSKLTFFPHSSASNAVLAAAAAAAGSHTPRTRGVLNLDSDSSHLLDLYNNASSISADALVDSGSNRSFGSGGHVRAQRSDTCTPMMTTNMGQTHFISTPTNAARSESILSGGRQSALDMKQESFRSHAPAADGPAAQADGNEVRHDSAHRTTNSSSQRLSPISRTQSTNRSSSHDTSTMLTMIPVNMLPDHIASRLPNGTRFVSLPQSVIEQLGILDVSAPPPQTEPVVIPQPPWLRSQTTRRHNHHHHRGDGSSPESGGSSDSRNGINTESGSSDLRGKYFVIGEGSGTGSNSANGSGDHPFVHHGADENSIEGSTIQGTTASGTSNNNGNSSSDTNAASNRNAVRLVEISPGNTGTALGTTFTPLLAQRGSVLSPSDGTNTGTDRSSRFTDSADSNAQVNTDVSASQEDCVTVTTLNTGNGTQVCFVKSPPPSKHTSKHPNPAASSSTQQQQPPVVERSSKTNDAKEGNTTQVLQNATAEHQQQEQQQESIIHALKQGPMPVTNLRKVSPREQGATDGAQMDLDCEMETPSIDSTHSDEKSDAALWEFLEGRGELDLNDTYRSGSDDDDAMGEGSSNQNRENRRHHQLHNPNKSTTSSGHVVMMMNKKQHPSQPHTQGKEAPQ